MTDKLPKDLANAKRGYKAFYDEQPNIRFEDLAYQYQMRWVRAARAIIEENARYSGPGRRRVITTKEEPSERDGFWEDRKTMKPKAFLEKHVPKTKSGKRYAWGLIKPKAKQEAAYKVYRSMINKAYKTAKPT